MKKELVIAIHVSVPFLYCCKTKNEQTADSSTSTRTTAYFDQEPTDSIPKLFASGVVSVDGGYEHGISFLRT